MDQFYELKINLQSFGSKKREIPLSVSSSEKKLATTLVQIDKPNTEIKLTIPKKDIQATIHIEDQSLAYDNDFYLSISKPEKVALLAIGSLSQNNFLDRIFTAEEFHFKSTELKTLDYNQIENQEAIVLNELDDLPLALGTTLKAFYEKGGTIILIPNKNNNPSTLNNFVANFGSLKYGMLSSTEKQITTINFSHPIYQAVFKNKVTNFQYPKVKSSFGLSGNTAVLQYEDQSIFIGSSTNQLGNFYAFAAPINKQNSNFQNAPLIVPTLYNMGQNQSKTGINAYTIGENQSLLLETVLTKDEAVAIQNNDYSFIPLQQILNTKCKLTFGDYPEKAGNYEVIKDEESLKKISFNFARTESDITAINSGIFDTFTKVNNIATVLNDLASERSSSEIWKWFLFGTLLLLCIELLIQKLIK
jgi:hypothetical protein